LNQRKSAGRSACATKGIQKLVILGGGLCGVAELAAAAMADGFARLCGSGVMGAEEGMDLAA
jgi:hypothetical protein